MRKTSGRHAGGGYLTVEFRSDEPGPEDFGLALAHGWLHIARQEDMKNVVSQEGHEQKAFDGAGIMLEHMVGVPFVGQLVEAIILDIAGALNGRCERRELGQAAAWSPRSSHFVVDRPACRVAGEPYKSPTNEPRAPRPALGAR